MLVTDGSRMARERGRTTWDLESDNGHDLFLPRFSDLSNPL